MGLNNFDLRVHPLNDGKLAELESKHNQHLRLREFRDAADLLSRIGWRTVITEDQLERIQKLTIELIKA